MKRQVIREIQKFFSIEELVCPHTYKAFGDKSWQFLDELLLVNLLLKKLYKIVIYSISSEKNRHFNAH